MKKFLFTLAALMMAGSLCAETTLVLSDFEVPADKLGGGNIIVSVSAVFEKYVSAMEVTVNTPEGLTFRGAQAGNDYGVSYMDNMGTDKVASPDITAMGNKFIIAQMAAAYGDDGDTFYGVVKWAPGNYENFLNFVFRAAADFKGGEISVSGTMSCGDDSRPEVAENLAKGVEFASSATVTVEGGSVEPEVTATPTINVEDNAEGEYLVISATGDGTVKLYIDGMPVSNPFQYNYQDEEHVITITATAQEEGKEISETATLTYTVPAKAVEPPVTYQTPAPELTYVVNDDAVVFTATGEGTVTIYINELRAAEPVATGEGTATYTIARGEEDVYVSAWATAQRDPVRSHPRSRAGWSSGSPRRGYVVGSHRQERRARLR